MPFLGRADARQCGAASWPSAAMSLTVASVLSVEPPAPYVTLKNSGSTAPARRPPPSASRCRSACSAEKLEAHRNRKARHGRDSDRRAPASHGERTRARLRCPGSRCRTSRAPRGRSRRRPCAASSRRGHSARVLDLASRADVDRLQIELRLTSRSSGPPSSGTSAGRTSASEMNERSPTTRSKRSNGSRSRRGDARTPSSAVTRGSRRGADAAGRGRHRRRRRASRRAGAARR